MDSIASAAILVRLLVLLLVLVFSDAFLATCRASYVATLYLAARHLDIGCSQFTQAIRWHAQSYTRAPRHGPSVVKSAGHER